MIAGRSGGRRGMACSAQRAQRTAASTTPHLGSVAWVASARRHRHPPPWCRRCLTAGLLLRARRVTHPHQPVASVHAGVHSAPWWTKRGGGGAAQSHPRVPCELPTIARRCSTSAPSGSVVRVYYPCGVLATGAWRVLWSCGGLLIFNRPVGGNACTVGGVITFEADCSSTHTHTPCMHGHAPATRPHTANSNACVRVHTISQATSASQPPKPASHLSHQAATSRSHPKRWGGGWSPRCGRRSRRQRRWPWPQPWQG